MKIREYALKINMTEECISETEKAFDSIKESGMSEAMLSLKPKFFEGDNCISELNNIAEKSGITTDMAKLVFCFSLLPETHRKFTEKGLSDEIFYDSISDITIWANVCKKRFGYYGMREYEWVVKTLRAALFKLGRFQYEKVTFKYRSYEKNGVHISRGDTVLNTHIPEGAPMPKTEREKSYRMAKEFFGINVFVFESYLAYTPQLEYLPEDSNIREMVNEFDVIEIGENPKNSDMWRIFGDFDDYRTADLPKNTSVQRAFAEFLAEHNSGNGYGVMVLE